jgi:uncharacterized membrane protein YhaH (DUF805 family)
MDWKTLFLTPEGRIGQRDFWIGFAIIFGAGLVLGMIPILGQLIGLLLIWPYIAVYAKRLHDFGKSGWLLMIPFGISCVAIVMAVMSGGAAIIGAGALGSQGDDAAAASAALAGMGVAFGFLGLAFLVGLAFLLWVGLSKGDPAANRYGPPPVSLTGGDGAPATMV